MSHRIFRLIVLSILLVGLMTLEAPPTVRAAGPWYVSTTGDDNNDCLSPATPCATINGAIGKASSGDTIYVGMGTYLGTSGEVVLIDRDITLSGGWDSDFTTQNSFTTIDGESSRRGIFVNSASAASLDHFVIRNGHIFSYGGGIYSDGNLSITYSSIHSNSIGNVCYGGGIFFNGTVLSIENSTVGNNSASCNGGGVFSARQFSTVTINNSTISNNQGGGVYNNGTFILNNTIISGNTREDCNGTTFTSLGNNIIGNTNNCTISATTGDQFNVDPQLGPFLPAFGFFPLTSSSPAVDAGDPASCLLIDQRGMARSGTCDIGAIEYVIPGPAVSLSVAGGNNQITGTGTAFPNPLSAAALDNEGNLVDGVTIDFLAPESGPSGTFSDSGTNTTSVLTDSNGIATTSVFAANDQQGLYNVVASAPGLGVVSFDLAQVVRPVNDAFANAVDITSLPFTAALDLTEATTQPNEAFFCSYSTRSVWYVFMPTENTTVRLDMAGSQVGGAVGIYHAFGSSIADLSHMACSYSGTSTNIQFEAGEIYYLQMISDSPGELQLNMEEITPPGNDNFADAETINGFPFNASADNTDATTEPGEPQNCSFPFRSLWYTFTPTENMALQLDVYNQFGASASIFVDNGTGLSGLTSLTCAYTGPGNLRNFQVDAGTKYYLRLDTFGQPGTIDVNLQQLTPPANDRFDGAEDVASLPFSATLDNTSASMELGESSVCGFPFRSVWYTFTPSETMTIRIQNTSPVYGAIDIFRADGPGIADLTSLACAFNGRSTNIQLEAGETYFLRVDSNGTPGILQFNFEQIFPPENDDFANAEPVTALPFNSSADNSSATAQFNEPTGCAFPTRTLWYSFTPTENTAVRANITGGPFGSAVDVYVASGSTFADLTFIGCASNGVAKNFRFEAGKTYYLRLDSVVEPGLLQLSLEQIVPPANDDFVNAELIGSLPFSATIDNTNATSEPGEQFGCGGVGKSVWYSFTPTENILVRLNTAGGGSSGNVSAFLATGPAISDLTFLTCAGNTSVFLQLEAGKTYYLRLDSFSQGEILQVNLVPSVPPVNDNIASATVATSLPFTATVDITDATYEFSEPQNCYNMLRTVWYSFTPTETMTLRADTLGSPINGNVNIYRSTGPGFSGLQFLNCSGPTNSASFLAEAGQTYYLQVGSSSGQTGIVNVNLVQAVPPVNDNLAQAIAVTSLPFTATVDITDATNEPDEPQICNFTPNTIWYFFAPSATTKVRADTMGGAVSGNVNIYQVIDSGFPGLQFIQCTGLGGATTFLAEAGQTYYFQVGGTGQPGEVQFNLSEVPVITGRITDAVTGAPLPGNIEPYTTVELYRICGDSCLDFVNSQNADSEGRFSFDSYYYGAPIPAGSYQINATANLYPTKSFGPFEFMGANLDVGDLPLDPPALIRGRAVDSATGSPLAGATVTLYRCDTAGCFEYVNSQGTDADGHFLFNSFYYGVPLSGGTYELEISAALHDVRRVQVTIADGENRDLGDVLVDPTPLIGSISGRLVDAATGRPIDLTFAPQLYLIRCDSNGCFYVNNMSPDGAGRFRFETDYAGNRLIIGTYYISYSADQYFSNQTNTFDVGVNMNRTVGDLRATSFPVRFSDVVPCADIPASGGDCDFTVKVWNGTAQNLSGKAWSLARNNLPDSFAGFTNFQIGGPQDLSIAKGKTRVLRFRLSLPANASPYGTYLCTRLFVGDGSQAFLNTIGFRDLFCVIRNATGYSIASPDTIGPPIQTDATTQTGTEIEPNNSCQIAQDVGVVSGQFIMDGLLDSSQAADVDFFRFTGTPGLAATIDLLGASFGNGTLGDPLLGFFDSNCNLLAFNDDSGSLNSRLEIIIPADGIFILAATAYPDFSFVGGGNGSYQLMVTPVTYIGSIRGVVTDAARGNPLSGAAAPFAYVRLLRCETYGCFDVNFQNAGSDGSFRFETDSGGNPLRTGSYMIISAADQYQQTQTEQFVVGEAENYDAGRIALPSYPIRFSEIQACSVPTSGGLCEFSVKVTNGLATRFSGKAWSMIDGSGLGSFANFTNFQTDTPVDLSLDSGKSIVLRFRFQVPETVANGAYICATAFVGQNPNALFNTSGIRVLFCFVKGNNGFTLLSEQEMHAQIQQMQVRTLPQPGAAINKPE